MNLVQLLEQNTIKRPDKMAIYYQDRSHTYTEFNNAVNRLSHGLVDLGLKKGEKIAFMMHFMHVPK